MIDIHCHILWGVDDGAKTLEESIKMARLAAADGVKTIVATPHFSNESMVTREVAERKVREMQQTLDQLGISIKLRAGNEVTLVSEAFEYEHAEQEAFGYLDEQKRFVLIEQSWLGYEPASPDIVRWFADRGTTMIIAHPERHSYFREQPSLLKMLLELGAWTQVSVDSLLGKNGEDARAFSLLLLKDNLVHTLATDAHNMEQRKPNLAEGFRWIREHEGDAKADAILERMSSL